MKSAGLIVLMMASLFAADVVYAYPITYVIESNSNGFSTYVTGCNGSSCDKLQERPYTVYHESGDNPSGYQDQNEYNIFGVSGSETFAEFDFAEGYLPHAYIIQVDDSVSSGPHTKTRTFEKKSSCTSEISSVATSSTPVKGEKTSIQVTAGSAFVRDAIPSSMQLPDSYKEFFSSKVRADVTVVNKTDGSTVTTLSGEKEILMGSSDKIEIEWTPSAEGTYNLKATTTVTDSACTSQTSKTSEKEIAASATGAAAAAPVASSGGGGGGGGRRRSTVTAASVSLPSTTTFALKDSSIEASPGDVVISKISIFNGEGATDTFMISLKSIDGFKATPLSVSIPVNITKTVDFVIDVRDAKMGKNNVIIVVEDGVTLTRSLQVDIDWDIEFEISQVVDEDEGVITINYIIQNKEPYDASGEIVIQDGENETSEMVIAEASSVTRGSIEYPIEYSGSHAATVSFVQDDETAFSEELEFPAEARRGLGTTGLFIAGGSITAGILILLVVLALLWIYEKRRRESPKPPQAILEKPILTKPLLQNPKIEIQPKLDAQPPAEPQKPDYYSSLFSEG